MPPKNQTYNGFLMFLIITIKLGITKAINKAVILTKCTLRGAPLINMDMSDKNKKTNIVVDASFNCFLPYNDLSKGLSKSRAQRRFLKVPASGNERS